MMIRPEQAERAYADARVPGGRRPREPKLPLPDNSGHNRTKIRRGRFIAAPAVDPVLLLPPFAGAKRKPFPGVERELDGWAWVNAEAALTAELRSLLVEHRLHRRLQI